MPLRHRTHAGTLLTNALQTLVTFSGGLIEGGAITWGFMLVNNDAVAHAVQVYVVPSGGAAADAYLKFSGSVPAGESVAVNGPFHNDSAAFIQAISDAALPKTNITVTASEEYL